MVKRELILINNEDYYQDKSFKVRESECVYVFFFFNLNDNKINKKISFFYY